MLIFDIETGPLPDDELNAVKPVFEADKRLKDPLKIQEDLWQKEQDWKDKAALSAVTGRVLAIGFQETHMIEPSIFSYDSEETIIREFWNLCERHQYEIVGFNIKGFDLPFLIRRSWKFGFKPPLLFRGRYFKDSIWDLMELWQLGDYRSYTSLDTIARYLSLGSKPDGISGADFSRLWFDGEANRQVAIDYLKNDIELTVKLYKRLCGAA